MADPNNMDYSIARAAAIGDSYGSKPSVTNQALDYNAVMTRPQAEPGQIVPPARERTTARVQSPRTESYEQADYAQGDYSQREVAYVEPAALDRPWTKYDRQVYDRLSREANGLVGHSINDYGSKIDPDVGCAVAVSLAVSRGYGFKVNEITVQGLERALKEKGFTEVGSTRDIKPSDIILAYRDANDYGHAALYMGNGQIFNNDSDSRLMRMESIGKYNSAEFKKFVILRRPAEVPALPRGSS